MLFRSGIAVLITLVMLFFYSRSIKSTLATLACSITAVIWQLGLLNAMGMGLDPYSMLVPFLVFAIGVSHGVQIVGAIAHKQEKGPGVSDDLLKEILSYFNRP